MAQPKAVLLDVDGTLLDSNRAHAEAYVAAARDLGFRLDLDDVLQRIGKGGDKVVPEISGWSKDDPRGRELDERKKVHFHELLPHLKPTRGARQLLNRLRADGLKLVVATSAKGEELQHLLDQAGVADLVQEAASSDDAPSSKPDPDIVEAAIERAGFPPHEIVMLGDTPYDVEAARRAGVGIVAVRCGGWNDDDLAGALAVYEDPLAIVDRFEESPFGRNS